MLDKTPLISIIVAVYNIETLLERCLDSILSQTYEKIEIILVNDGSTDSSKEICDKYTMRDQRIQVIHKKNGGLSDARNAGLLIAKGEYIGFVDGDDFIEPTMYEELINACLTYQVPMAQCRYNRVYKDGVEDGGSGAIVYFTTKDFLDAYIFERSPYLIYHSVWSKLFRKDIVKGVTFAVGRNSEDIIYSTKAFCKMKHCVYIDKGLYNYIIDRDGSIMNEKSGKRCLEDEIPFFYEQIALFEENGFLEEAQKARYMLYKRMLYYYMILQKEKKNRIFAKQIKERIYKEKEMILNIYALSFVKKGDLYRMKLFLRSHVLYRSLIMLYENILLPMKRRLRERGESL